MAKKSPFEKKIIGDRIKKEADEATKNIPKWVKKLNLFHVNERIEREADKAARKEMSKKLGPLGEWIYDKWL
jgi:hypothetical protein